jgi:uncharacterized protein YhaN
MLINTLHIRRFGCLDDFEAKFRPGLNVIRGPNESGKSTLHQALLMALIELPNQNKKNSVWRAWGSDRWYRLQLTFVDPAGREYQITKDFQTGLHEICLPDGESTTSRDQIQSALERVLGASSLLMLRSTLFVEQDALSDITSGRTEIAHSLETIVTGGEDDIYTEQALKRLDNEIREFRRGSTRPAARPGPLARTRDRQVDLRIKVRNYRELVREYESDEIKLEETENRLAEIDQRLGLLRITLANANRLLKLRKDLAEWEHREKALEAKLRQIQSAQNEIREVEKSLQTLGAVALLSEQDKRDFDQLVSRFNSLREDHERHQKDWQRYQDELAEHQQEQRVFDDAYAQYEADLSAYQQAEEQYKADLAAYNAAVARYNQELSAYQEAWQPYEAMRAAQRQESEQYEIQRLAYQKALAPYKEDLEKYNSTRAEQDRLMAEYEQAYEAYELQLAAYEQERDPALKRGDSTGVESADASPATLPGWLAFLAVGALSAVTGLLLMILNGTVLPVAFGLLALGVFLLLFGFWRSSRRAVKRAAPATLSQAQIATQESHPSAVVSPKPPQRPRPETLIQPVAPIPPEPPSSSGEKLEPPALERPRPPAVEQPQPQRMSRPEPPAPLSPPPQEPDFDIQRLKSTAAAIKQQVEAASCVSVNELNSRYERVVALRNQSNTAHSRLEGLLGDETADELEQQRREASRQRRDAGELLEQPGLQQAARLTPLEVNQLATEIEDLETGQVELQKKRQQLQFKMNHGAVSSEALLQAEESLEAATAEYRRVQERLDVYELTYRLLSEARSRALKQAQTRLGPQTASYLQRLTHGRYRQAWIDSELNIELQDPIRPDRRIRPERLSRGAQDQLYMAARLALVDLLFPDTRPPIVLDDPFVHFDPRRLEAAIKMCIDVATERQILLFTCSEDYNHVGHHILMPSLQA